MKHSILDVVAVLDPPLENENILSNDKTVAETFCEFFSNVKTLLNWFSPAIHWIIFQKR